MIVVVHREKFTNVDCSSEVWKGNEPGIHRIR